MVEASEDKPPTPGLGRDTRGSDSDTSAPASGAPGPDAAPGSRHPSLAKGGGDDDVPLDELGSAFEDDDWDDEDEYDDEEDDPEADTFLRRFRMPGWVTRGGAHPDVDGWYVTMARWPGSSEIVLTFHKWSHSDWHCHDQEEIICYFSQVFIDVSDAFDWIRDHQFNDYGWRIRDRLQTD